MFIYTSTYAFLSPFSLAHTHSHSRSPLSLSLSLSLSCRDASKSVRVHHRWPNAKKFWDDIEHYFETPSQHVLKELKQQVCVREREKERKRERERVSVCVCVCIHKSDVRHTYIRIHTHTHTYYSLSQPLIVGSENEPLIPELGT